MPQGEEQAAVKVGPEGEEAIGGDGQDRKRERAQISWGAGAAVIATFANECKRCLLKVTRKHEPHCRVSNKANTLDLRFLSPAMEAENCSYSHTATDLAKISVVIGPCIQPQCRINYIPDSIRKSILCELV
ncbi:hypothetical protein EJB05_31487, partial [Eragrostis curvula]